MTGWNMPPGCNVSDIPGNRPEDMEAESFADDFFNKAEELGFDITTTDTKVEKLCEWVWERIGKAYGEGYKRGVQDGADVGG